ncbi:MAG: glycosyltransferase, partial [Coriobacteriia bacterium]|nr:glycosyltransferase [Coriobacteriia bacterium]MCL2871341.1 glycosyltransferase [Coriobacteriia bacterium]
MNTFKISVIIPIYNTEDYLDEAIESITSQSIGFKENIQLILV